MAVAGGIRTPKERTSTSTGLLTTLEMRRRGTMTRGLGQGLPVESSTCSQGRQVARGTACRLRNISGSLEWMAIFSYCGSQPYSVMPSTRTNQPSSPSVRQSLPELSCMLGGHMAMSSVTGAIVQVSLMDI